MVDETGSDHRPANEDAGVQYLEWLETLLPSDRLKQAARQTADERRKKLADGSVR